jgi:transcriptional regulator with XRE-family HTH domain
MSQADTARQSGIDQSQLSKAERIPGNISIGVARRLALVFNLEPQDFYKI